MSALIHYLESLYKEFADNRQKLNIKWKKNKDAYDGVIGKEVDNKVGMGNKGKNKGDWRSKTVLNITRTKVHAGEILVNDVICAGGELPFTLHEDKCFPDGRKKMDLHMPDQTLIPPEYEGMSVEQIFEAEKQLTVAKIGIALQNGELTEEEAAEAYNGTVNAVLPPRPKTSAELMTDLIKEQLQKCDAMGVVQKAVRSAAIYGEGIGKVFCKDYKRRGFVEMEDGSWQLSNENIKSIGLKNISIFDFFTDLENRDLQNNAGVFERSYMSRSEIIAEFDPYENELVIPYAIEKIANGSKLSDGEYAVASTATKDDDSPHLNLIERRRRTVEVIEFWGRVPEAMVEDFETERMFNGIVPENIQAMPRLENNKYVEIMAVFCEGEIIKFCRAENKLRPFFRVDWEDPVDDVAPRSIADICDTMQQSLNSTLRLYEDNKKLSANVIMGRIKKHLANKNDDNELYPGKTIDVDENCDDIRRALQPFIIPDVGESLLNSLSFYRMNCNEQSMIPDIAHGVAASSKTTAYEISLQNEKAGKYISSIVKNIDRFAIVPIIQFFYEWNMYDPNTSNELKGAYSVRALGYSTYQDKSMRQNRVMQLIQLLMGNEVFANFANVKNLLVEACKAYDIDPEQFLVNEQVQSMQDVKFQQFQQAVAQQIGAFGEQLNGILEQLPSLAERSEEEAVQMVAKTQKLLAEAQSAAAEAEVKKNKILDNRAKTIASVEQRNNTIRNDNIRLDEEIKRNAAEIAKLQVETNQRMEELANRPPVDVANLDITPEPNYEEEIVEGYNNIPFDANATAAATGEEPIIPQQ